jgi:hypothetical protein
MIFQMRRFLLVTVLLFAVGCDRDAAQSLKPMEPAASIPNQKAAQQDKTDVVKIVFVGQKRACEGTRKRIDTTWKNLQDTLGQRNDVAVESIQLDVDEERADKLEDLRSLIVPPGLYFFDANENLVEMLQGELISEQIAKVL